MSLTFFCCDYTGLFEMNVGVLTPCHLVLQMQPHVISFYGVTSMIRFMFLLFLQVSRNKVRIRTTIETITANMLQTVWNELDYRVEVCRITKGAHTGCPRRNVPDFGRVFLMLKYTDITQNTYVQS